jgi:hypothetical protein
MYSGPMGCVCTLLSGRERVSFVRQKRFDIQGKLHFIAIPIGRQAIALVGKERKKV